MGLNFNSLWFGSISFPFYEPFLQQPYVPERQAAAIAERWLLQEYSILKEERFQGHCSSVVSHNGLPGMAGTWNNNAFLLKQLLFHLWGPVFAFQTSCKDGEVEKLGECNLLSHDAVLGMV